MKRLISIGVAIILSGATATFTYRHLTKPSLTKATVVKWDMLDKLDYKTGAAPKELSALNGQMIRVPGFVVPLEDDYRSASEFLLVPDPGSCIHVPPPPPNQMVYVKMRPGVTLRLGGLPFWIYGILKIDNVNSPYGSVAYSLDGVRAAGFKAWNDPGEGD